MCPASIVSNFLADSYRYTNMRPGEDRKPLWCNAEGVSLESVPIGNGFIPCRCHVDVAGIHDRKDSAKIRQGRSVSNCLSCEGAKNRARWHGVQLSQFGIAGSALQEYNKNDFSREGDGSMEYQLIRSKRKTISLTITPQGELVVRSPERASRREIEEILARHSLWIDRHIQKAQEASNQKAAFGFRDGEEILFLGSRVTLASSSGECRLIGNTLWLPMDESRRSEALTAWMRRQAQGYIPGRVEFYSCRMGLVPTRVSITAAKTRWGSCSGKNTLNFSLYLMGFPPEVIDAVVVHELAHIREKNHSASFYRLVENTMPDYRLHAAVLKERQREALNWV